MSSNNSQAGPHPVHPLSGILFGWVGHKRTANVILVFIGILCAFLTLIDVVFDRHEYFKSAEIPSFYGVYGFLAFGFVVLMGWPLGRILRRDENFYGDADIASEAEDAMGEEDTL